ncbi:hypothetical protein OS493_029772 [Desmophyllum pertusum]|uniref:Amino acid transporter transmembrane domain-containing protein n=1 Tax=Desmophyllum pertusum TaxID=174260 RepID=A0A9X0CQR3_9CNID|nr:hypothetical protein OS493_029772 [Desmophyllum pertusum]
MEGKGSNDAEVNVIDEKSPLLSVQGNPNNGSNDRLSLSSNSISSSRNQDDNSRTSGNSQRSSVIDNESQNSMPKRKPFHYNSLTSPILTSHDMDLAAKYNRYKYISRLSRHNVIIPSHMLPPQLFLIIPKETDEKQSSLVTILEHHDGYITFEHTMGYQSGQCILAGFGLAIILLILMAGICLYSCYLIIKCAEETANHCDVLEFSDICKKYLGKPGELIAVLFSLAAIAGSAIVFWVLMSSFLFNSGKFIHESIHHAYSVPTSMNSSNATLGHLEVLCPGGGHSASSSTANNLVIADTSSFFKFWQLQYTVPFFLIVVLFPLCSVKSPTFFTKFNALGTLSVIYIIVFIIIKASIWGVHMDFSSKTPMFKDGFPALTGILTLAYFIHNCILSIMRNQEHPENNVRDLSIAYCLVAVTYILVGLLFYATFPIEKSCIQQVLLDNLPAPDVMTFVARLFLLFQLTTVFPLIIYIIRVQFMLYFFNKIYPSFLHVFLLNFVLIGACVLFAVVYPHVGNIIRYVGSLSGLAYNYSLPCIVYMMIQKQRGTLSLPSAVFHSLIVVLGVLNFMSQFFVAA